MAEISISFELVPITHIIFMIICWISFFIYFRILYIVSTRQIKEFKSSFFQIVKFHTITDMLMFLFVEFVARPRKYKIHNLLYPINDNWLPQLIYFSQTLIKNTMFLGYIVVAVNRFTAVFQVKRHEKIWTPMIIAIIYSLEWIVPSTVLWNLFYNTGNHNFSFLPSSNGGLSLRADTDFMKLDALQDYILSTLSFLISSLLYLSIIAFILKNSKFSQKISTSTFRKEHIIFKCALFSFLFFIPNFIKTTVLYFATDTAIVNFATDLWYFTTEIMSISSCWSLLMGSKRLREEFFPNFKNPFLVNSMSISSGLVTI